ncbi:hypothetical protein [Streptomyces sp. NPDC058466]|uniref:hypothetical protein n=1 Tax=Streptomyces sp. NPDC058466 TaxID=3346512 RepID=UPI0036577AB1
MIAEAVDTATSIGWAIAAWIVLTAAAATLALYTVVVTAAWPCRAAAEAVTAALAASRAVRALHGQPDRYRPSQARAAPQWARGERDHREAA